MRELACACSTSNLGTNKALSPEEFITKAIGLSVGMKANPV
jgi:hypothetical protein